MIPGVIISFLTFPGVILHEFAHKKFCDWFNVKVFDVKYFKSDGGGHVIHERTKNYKAIFWISTGPLIINSIACFLLALLAGLFYEGVEIIFWFLAWLSLSFGSHSFPSNQDANNVFEESKKRIKEGGNIFHYLSYPFVLIIGLANILRFFWIDFIWAFLIMGLAFSFVGASVFEDSGFTGVSYEIGDYRCSEEHNRISASLEPDRSKGQELDSVTDALDLQANGLDALERDLTYSNVDEYSPQYQIDSYNNKIEEYNTKLESLQLRYSKHQAELDTYNAEVERYNKYLEDNCESLIN